MRAADLRMHVICIDVRLYKASGEQHETERSNGKKYAKRWKSTITFNSLLRYTKLEDALLNFVGFPLQNASAQDLDQCCDKAKSG